MKSLVKPLTLLIPSFLLLVGCASRPAPVTEGAVQPPQVCYKMLDTLRTLDQKASYALGLEIGTAFKGLNANHIDLDAFSQGLRDTLMLNQSLMSAEEATVVKREFFELIQTESANVEKQRGETFRQGWTKGHGEAVKKTESGLLYRVIVPGVEKRAVMGDEIAVHYSGKLIDGTEFDSSRRRNAPFVFKLQEGTVIEGWTEILPLMQEGSKIEVVIPPELAYGDRDMRVIPANATLVFEIELLKINPTEAQINALTKGEPMPADEPAVEAPAAAAAPAAAVKAPEAKPVAKPAAAPAPAAEVKAPEAKPVAKPAPAAAVKAPEAKPVAKPAAAVAPAAKAPEAKPVAKPAAAVAPAVKVP